MILRFLMLPVLALSCLQSVLLAKEDPHRNFLEFAEEDPTRHTYEVFSALFLNRYPQFKVETREVELRNGYRVHSIKTPWAIQSELTTVYAEADFNTIDSYLQTKGLRALKVNSKALVVFYFFNHKDSGAGPYEELLIGYMSFPSDKNIKGMASVDEFINKKSELANTVVPFFDHLTLGGPDENFMNVHVAIWSGRVSISYPKFYGRSIISETTHGYQIVTDQPEVPYFKEGKSDSQKARSLKVTAKIDFVRDDSKHSEEETGSIYYITETLTGGLCYVDNPVVIKNGNYGNLEKLVELNIEGESSTAKRLLISNTKAVHAQYANSVQGILLMSPRADNGCIEAHIAGGLPYDYRLFYPETLVKKLPPETND